MTVAPARRRPCTRPVPMSPAPPITHATVRDAGQRRRSESKCQSKAGTGSLPLRHHSFRRGSRGQDRTSVQRAWAPSRFLPTRTRDVPPAAPPRRSSGRRRGRASLGRVGGARHPRLLSFPLSRVSRSHGNDELRRYSTFSQLVGFPRSYQYFEYAHAQFQLSGQLPPRRLPRGCLRVAQHFTLPKGW